MKFDSIIFDLDGTLWDATKEVCDTWNIILSKYYNGKVSLSLEELQSCMGMRMEDIAKKLFGDIEEKQRTALLKDCCELENSYLKMHGGTPYPQLTQTLELLKRNHKLFIVSNCQEGYIQSFLEAHNMWDYFTDFESAGKTGLSKGENNKLVIQRNHLENAIYVGDTQGDAQSAKDAGIPFIFAKYGFGEVEKYDYVIHKFSDLMNLPL